MSNPSLLYTTTWGGKVDHKCCVVQQDAILKVTSTAICGSDLHMYVGAMPGMRKGDLLGHEVRRNSTITGSCCCGCLPASFRLLLGGRD